MKMHRLIVLPFAIAVLATLPPPVQAQSPAYSEASPPPAAGSATPSLPYPNRTYTRPTEKTKLRNYFVDAFGPYPIVGAAVVAGVNQAQSTPPEWGQGASGYGKRFVSNIAIATVATTTRYALAEAFREDTIYYRCECKGFFPRLSHALAIVAAARCDARNPSRLLFSRSGGSLCRHDDCSLWMVSRPLRLEGRLSHGQLCDAGICGPECCSGIPLRAPLLIVPPAYSPRARLTKLGPAVASVKSE
jgi:hypothetical protein